MGYCPSGELSWWGVVRVGIVRWGVVRIRKKVLVNMMMMMMMIHSISSAPFICENHIQRRLAPQIVIINFTFAGKGVF